MATWYEPEPVEVPEELSTYVSGHVLVAQTLVRRGIKTAEDARSFLYPEFYRPVSALGLPGMESAAARIEQAIEHKERICVWGDFDVDGQTATTLLVQAFQRLGADVFHHIPVRKTESHGLNAPWVMRVIDEGANLIVTCDTGIADVDEVAISNAMGVDVVITDHHVIPEELPDAVAIVNPQMLPEGHALRTLPGVGVAYKLVELLFERRGLTADVETYLDLVALGIVADVALQVGDTRYLLQRGLEILRKTDRHGLQALYEIANINPARIDSEMIGFVIGPRLNALGRLSDANMIVDFLTTKDVAAARVTAARLEGLNTERKHITEQIFQGAQAQLSKRPEIRNEPALVLSHAGWDPGIIGIVASRLVEMYHKPVLMIALNDEGVGRASARSIEGINITEAIAEQENLLLNFGGHPMAAGFSINQEDIAAFRARLSKVIRSKWKNLTVEPSVHIDGYLKLPDLSVDLIADIARLGPFGAGNPALIFASRELVIQQVNKIGRNGEHLRIIVSDPGGVVQEVLWWRGKESDVPEGKFDLAYTLQVNEFRGKSSVQIVWLDARHVEVSKKTREKPAGIEVLDYRAADRPEEILRGLMLEEDITIWSEGIDEVPEEGVPRQRLKPARTLVIWTAPPALAEIELAIEKTGAEKIYLFGNAPRRYQFSQFIEKLAGICKYALRAKSGVVDIEVMAGLTGETSLLVLKGLAWLRAKGVFDWVQEGDRVTLMRARAEEDVDLIKELALEGEKLLRESWAFRQYYLRVEKNHLFRP